jgi:hypothetical protein
VITSRAKENPHHSYVLGANFFLSTPVIFEGLATVLRDLFNDRFDIVKRSRESGRGS